MGWLMEKRESQGRRMVGVDSTDDRVTSQVQ